MPAPGRSRAALLYAVPAVLLLVALYARWADGAWDYSDGVYAYTARAIAHGATPYRDIVVAQPPGTLLFGAGALTLHDSVWMLRAALSAVLFLQGALAAVAVRRLTGRDGLAVVAGLAAFLMPWTLREHTALVPEALGAPLLLAVALLASRPRQAAWAGALAAVAVAVKLPLVLPVLAVAVVLRGRERRAYLTALPATGAVLGLLALAAFGGDLVDQVVTAQRETGLHDAVYVVKLAVQALWNEAPVLALLLVGFRVRAACRDPALLAVLLALLAGCVVSVASIAKNGTFLQVLIPVEAILVVLATASVAGWRGAPVAAIAPPSKLLRFLAVAGVALVVAQAAALLLRPSDPVVFARPFSAATFGREASPDDVGAAVAIARRCPPGSAYRGTPYLAFRAGRRLPGDQGDPYLLGHAPSLAPIARRVAADGPLCP